GADADDRIIADVSVFCHKKNHPFKALFHSSIIACFYCVATVPMKIVEEFLSSFVRSAKNL
ncbi:MAG: hypothetical protein II738_04310, partial [Clostridia bacterium]|nr:hypothetical protein [Clostridia bacterium]